MATVYLELALWAKVQTTFPQGSFAFCAIEFRLNNIKIEFKIVGDCQNQLEPVLIWNEFLSYIIMRILNDSDYELGAYKSEILNLFNCNFFGYFHKLLKFYKNKR